MHANSTIWDWCCKCIPVLDHSQGYDLDSDVEAAAHFDHWQRAHLDDLNVRQDLWPEALRNARVIPAVEYIQVSAAHAFCCCKVTSDLQMELC